MPVATYNQKPPQVQAIQIAADMPTLQLIANFVSDQRITSAQQLRAILGNNDMGVPAQIGDWVVHDVGGLGYRILSNLTFQATYQLAT